MKGLQGERLRQAFKYFDKDQDGFIRPEQFKQIILVRMTFCSSARGFSFFETGRKLLDTNYRTLLLRGYQHSVLWLLEEKYRIRKSLHSTMLSEVRCFVTPHYASVSDLALADMDMVERLVEFLSFGSFIAHDSPA